MNKFRTAPFGTWETPITSSVVSSSGVQIKEISVEDGHIYWLEGRPDEGGRYVLVARSRNGALGDLTPKGFNVRNAVHEYGGGSYVVHRGVVYFCNWEDQRIYRQCIGESPVPITPAPKVPFEDRYADLSITPNGLFLTCVRERHVEGSETVNEVVSVSTNGLSDVKVLATGYDFYSSPRVSLDGNKIAWLSWNHPNMPWDNTELWLADLNGDCVISSSRHIAGGDEESILQPEWSPVGTLYFISDRSGWWNLYACDSESTVAIFPSESDAGGPSWNFGFSTYTFTSNKQCVLRNSDGTDGRFELLSENGDLIRTISVPYSDISYVSSDAKTVFFLGAGPSNAPEIVALDLGSEKLSVLKKSCDVEIDEGYISIPKAIKFPTTDDGQAHAFYYAPRNAMFRPTKGELPPLMVVSHGGPTSASTPALSLSIQFWTSRGFGVVDVNYRGSTGYGRAYRNALRANWGHYDTDDCVNAATFLVNQGVVDRNRVVIRGGSAGGYTTINALTFTDFFAAGATYYGIADLSIFIGDTHKFESRYLDSLVGAYPEFKQRYHDRSAIHFTDQLSCPMIIFQGLEDKVVPPSQADVMVEALRRKQLPFAYLAFEGEQHGFRQAVNIERSLEAELYFYGKVLRFEPAGDIQPVDIENLP